MTSDASPSRTPDPISGLAVAFAASLGVVVDPTARLEHIWAALTAHGEATPGLAFASWVAPGAFGGTMMPLLANSPTVSTALEHLERFHPLFERDRVVLTRRSASASLTLQAPSGGPAVADSVDAFFALVYRMFRQLAGLDAAPGRVLLRRPAPADPTAHHELLGDVWFEAGRDACEFDAVSLRLPVLNADPVILSMLEPYAQHQVDRLGRSWTWEVLRALDFHSGQTPKLADIARSLMISERALQLRLGEEDTTFSAVLEQAQRDHALALLSGSDLPVTAIAGRVGFTSPAAFTRAVRRWTGQSPTGYRHSQSAAGTCPE